MRGKIPLIGNNPGKVGIQLGRATFGISIDSGFGAVRDFRLPAATVVRPARPPKSPQVVLHHEDSFQPQS
jgi:hypothetical protein